MRVGFDVSPLSEPAAFSAGVRRLADGLTRALEERGVVEVERLAPEPGADLRRWRRRRLPRAVAERELIGLHSFTSAFAPFGPGARVQTVHELPWRHGVRENAGLRHRLWAGLGSRLADRVLCGTDFVANDLKRGLAVRSERVVTCPWGVGPPFADEPPPGEVDEALLGHYRLPEDPLVVCPGAVRAKKNLAAVLAGVAEVRRRGGPRLVVVVTGGDTPDLRRDLGLAARLGLSGVVSTPGEIDESHWPGFLRLASVVPVLSHSEGFAFPVLEALACGTPVVVPRQSAQSEVAGAFGIEVDPEDHAAVADGLEHAVAEREALRFTLADRARELSWERCAQQVEVLWRELAERGAR